MPSKICPFLIFPALTLFAGLLSASTSGLQVSYGSTGIQELTYNGVVLENLAANSSDAFHIWHMRATDLNGNLLTGGQYDWGEVNNGKTWNATTQTWTYSFVWGSITTQFVQSGNTLNMNVVVTNSANSGIIFDGANIFPFVLNFPALPAGFTNASYEQLSFNTTGPSVLVADYGQGEVAAVYASAATPLYSGFQPASVANAYTPIISGTSINGMATFFPVNNRPLPPGHSDSYTVSLRFAPSGTPTSALAADAYKNWAQTWPPVLKWTDRRAIGTVYLASSPAGNPNLPGGYPNNPRRYFNNSNAADFNVTTAPGLIAFQNKILQQAANNVQNLQQLNAQGAITWDIEGEQYPQTTSYVCEPDEIAQVAPEMESVISNASSPYNGMKLDDAYFKIIRTGGFRVGVCVRPQHFTLNSNGTASQVELPDSQVAAELIRKMSFAHSRWGTTLFYIDSTVDATGAALDAGIFQQVAAAFPDSLLIPEESTPKYYAYTAPFLSFIFHGDLGTPADVYNYYPNAFSANLINDVSASTLAEYQPQLSASVKLGDVLMAHADYWQANNPTIVAIYQNAGGAQAPPPPSAPPPVQPPSNNVEIISPAAGQTVSGTISVSAQINATLDSAGSYLLVDGAEVGTARVTSAPYVYSLNTANLSNGSHSIQVWAHDTGNQTLLSSDVSITISNTGTPSPPPPPPPPTSPSSYPISLTYPAAGQTISGTVTVLGTISQTLDSAGSYLMVDGQEVGTVRVTSGPYAYPLDTSTLTAGQHTLQIWAHDTGNDTLLSNPLTVTVP